MRVVLIIITGIMLTLLTPVSKRPPTTPTDDGGTVLASMGQEASKRLEEPLERLLPALLTPFTLPEPAFGRAPEADFDLLADYAYSETLPPVKPADVIVAEFRAVPVGTPREEIRRVSARLGLDIGLMNTFARIESDFNPKDRTGSYMGLFQLSRHEFDRYGPTKGEIFNARDNALAAGLKIEYEAILFKIDTRHIPSNSDLYLIHQQGIQGAAEHLAEPGRLAWKSMCATDEGHQKGVGWCKRAIWGNTLPAFKQLWKTVENFTSGAFVRMWSERVAIFLGQVTPPQVTVNKKEHGTTKHSHKIREVRMHRHSKNLVHRYHHLRHYAHA